MYIKNDNSNHSENVNYTIEDSEQKKHTHGVY